MQWIREGNRNVRFFHHATIVFRYGNLIRALRSSEGQWIVEDDDIIREITQFFRSMWTLFVGGLGSFESPPLFDVAFGQEN